MSLEVRNHALVDIQLVPGRIGASRVLLEMAVSNPNQSFYKRDGANLTKISQLASCRGGF